MNWDSLTLGRMGAAMAANLVRVGDMNVTQEAGVEWGVGVLFVGFSFHLILHLTPVRSGPLSRALGGGWWVRARRPSLSDAG